MTCSEKPAKAGIIVVIPTILIITTITTIPAIPTIPILKNHTTGSLVFPIPLDAILLFLRYCFSTGPRGDHGGAKPGPEIK